MARLIGPSEASREVKTIVTSNGATKGLFKSKALRPAEYYTDPDPTATPTVDMLTERADILTLAGDAIADGTVTIDAYSFLPLMQFPDGADSVLVVIDGGPPWRVYAREDDRLDALAATVADLAEDSSGAVAAEANARASADTALAGLITAEATARATADTAVATAAATDATTKANAAQATAIQRANHTGTQSADTLTDGTTNKAFLATERTKLAGIATGATANATDAQLRDRALHTGAQATSTITGLDAALAGKVAKGNSFLSVLDYTTGNGTTDDTTGWNNALAAAATFGAAVFAPIPAAHYKITGPLTPYAGSTIVGAGRGCEIRQYTRTNKPVFDCLNVDGVTVTGFTFSLDGGPLTAVGSAFRAENGYTYCTGVWSNGSGNTFSDLRVKDFATAVTLSAWDGVSAQSTTMRTGNTIRDLEISGTNFGILWMGQDGLRISNINCHDAVDSSVGTNPLHTFYGTGNATLRSRNVVISDCVTRNITFGCAYQAKYVDGLTMTNMIAENCQGLFNGIDINDASFGVMTSRADTAGTGASFAIQKVTTQPARITIDTITIHKAADAVGSDRCMSIIADDVRADNLNLFPNCNVATSNYAAYLRGARITVGGLKLTNKGSAKCRGVLVGFGASFPTSDVSIIDPEMTNVSALVDFETTVTGNNVVAYGPGLQRDIGTSTNYFNEISGTAAFTLSRREWTNTRTVSGGGTYTPVPPMETVSRFNVTDATAFTIGAPAGVPKTGMTQDIAIVNGTAGSLGAITWNAAYALRAAFVAPPAGEAHRITFAYNGTTWREVSRSQGAVLDTSAALTAIAADAPAVGEFVPRRDRITSNAVSISSGALALGYFTADKTETISTLTAYSGTVAAAATPTLCRMGIYSVDVAGDLTLVASTVNDTTLFAATNLAYPKALSVPLSKVVGQRYAVGVLVVSGATMPTFHGYLLASTGVVNTIVRESPAIIGRLTGQTDLPASITAGTLVGLQGVVAMKLS